tara:strand:+ start:125 stop:835 length:711 start_codon:yes stop_codon:yes gene_type:complete
VLPSFLLHLPVFLVLMSSFGTARDEAPLIDRDVYMVSTVVLPKAVGLPDKASAPRPRAEGVQEAPEAPPPRPNEMLLTTPEAPEDQGEEKAQPKEPPKEKPKSPSRADLLARLNVEEGEARFATDPDSDSDIAPDTGLQQRFGRSLTAYERRVRDTIQYNWFPKFRGAAKASLWSAVSFTIDDNGTIRDPRIEQTSGDFVYDQSCLRAVSRTRRVPPPPANANRSISVGFSPEDKP